MADILGVDRAVEYDLALEIGLAVGGFVFNRLLLVHRCRAERVHSVCVRRAG